MRWGLLATAIACLSSLTVTRLDPTSSLAIATMAAATLAFGMHLIRPTWAWTRAMSAVFVLGSLALPRVDLALVPVLPAAVVAFLSLAFLHSLYRPLGKHAPRLGENRTDHFVRGLRAVALALVLLSPVVGFSLAKSIMPLWMAGDHGLQGGAAAILIGIAIAIPCVAVALLRRSLTRPAASNAEVLA